MTHRWVIAGGGTGGHVTPALALAEVLAEQGDAVLVIGSAHGLEARLLPAAGFELVALGSRQFMGQGVAGRLRGGLGILAAAARARGELARFSADAVISVGGYAAMPAAMAAVIRRTPLALVEPNALPGRVNRLTARFARRIFLGHAGAARHLSLAAKERVHCLGVPLRVGLVRAFTASARTRKPAPPFRVLVFGGSQGAHQINEAVIGALPRLAKSPVEFFHQTGEADLVRVEAAYSESEVRGRAVAFEPDMPARYAWADVAVCRAGALTTAELALAGLPALLVPYPYAADDHQRVNARELERAGASGFLDPASLDGDVLAGALEELFAEPDRLVAMGQAASALARPDAAREIAAECVRMLGEPRGVE